MNFGLTPPQYEFITEQVVNPIEALGAKVYCYGSRARGTHHTYSDLDLMVESEYTTPQLEAKISEVQEQLSNSNFQLKVDLVLFKNFAESYKENYQKDKAPWLKL